MRDRFIQEAIEASSFTFVFIDFSGFLRGTNLLIQELRIDGKLVHEVGGLFRVSQQALAPLFCLIVFAFVSIIDHQGQNALMLMLMFRIDPAI